MSEPETRATRAAAAAGIPHRIVTYGRVRSAEEAAAARGVPLAALVKTLVVRVREGDHRLVAIPGDRVIDWAKLRALLGVTRLTMANSEELVDATGYVRGTVTPFGAEPAWPLIVDAAVCGYDEVSIGGGEHGVAIHLAPADLIAGFEATVADVSRPDG